MKSKIQLILISIIGIYLVGCEQTSTSTAPEPVQSVATVEIPKYSAEAFFETTSFRMVGSAGYAFSPDGKAILMSSDQTGVFNVYSLGLGDDVTEQLTQSVDNAVFAVSWFPADKRVLYTYDGGGNELNHVFVRELDGSTRDLTPGDNLKAGFLA